MSLPSSGTISMDMIRAELGVPSQSPFSLNTARSGGYVPINYFAPSYPPNSGEVSLASWYNYCQNCGFTTGTFYYDATSPINACGGTPDTTLYWSGTLTYGTILYTDISKSEAAQGWWSDGTNSYFQNCPDGCGDGITNIVSCTQPTIIEVNFQNAIGGDTITNIKFNGVDVVPFGGATFPMTPSITFLQAYVTNPSLNGTLEIYEDISSTSIQTTISDSLSYYQCQNPSSGNLFYQIYNVSLNDSQIATLTIDVTGGACAGPPSPPPPLSSYPFNAAAVSRGSGQYMIAGISNFSSSAYQSGPIYISSNYGSSWFETLLRGYWYKVAISDDGSHMLAVENYGKAYLSTNYGSTWSELTQLGVSRFRGAAISGNGNYMMVSAFTQNYECLLYVSKDYGVTWTISLGNSRYDYISCAIDSSGANFYVAGSAGSPYVFRSTNQGLNWSIVYSTSNFTAFVSDVNCTSDGSKIVAPTFGQVGGLLKSSDYGASWVTTASSNSWVSASINNDIPSPSIIPTSYVAAEGNDYLQKSEGTSANTNTSAGVRTWRAVSNSNDGQYILAAAYNGLYLSTNYGISFTTIS
jgi:photosystem II stability/assembly factor-like uncharacterized protein